MSKSKPRTELQRTIDDMLTGKINNQLDARKFILQHIAHMSYWIHDCFNTFSQPQAPEEQNEQPQVPVAKADPLVQVYIKGNAALKLYRMNTEKPSEENGLDKNWSDFDNQIIINPYLPKAWWYEILNQVHTRIKHHVLPNARDGFLLPNPAPKVKKSIKVPPNVKVKIKKKNNQQGVEVDNYNGGAVLNKVEFKNEELKAEMGQTYLESFPALGTDFTLEHAVKMQSNVLLCTSSEYLHPNNYFDNVRTVFSFADDDLDFMDTSAKHREANDFYPPAVQVLKDFKGKKEKHDSSIWINTSIAKFLLYRLIVRYKKPGVGFDGKSVRQDVNEEAIKFRGEVIDISIPRRESEETLNQWTRFGDRITPIGEDNEYRKQVAKNPEYIHVPDWHYQLEENINMINEVLTYKSGSPHKFYKRLDRARKALRAIEAESQKPEVDPKPELHADNIFSSEIKPRPSIDLAKVYAAAKDNAIKMFYKQLALILQHDYQSAYLTSEVSNSIKSNLLPDIKNEALVYQNGLKDWLTNFNVVKEGSNETLATAIIDSKIQDGKEVICELLMCNEITHKIYQAISQSYALSWEQLEQVNSLRQLFERSDETPISCYFDGIVSAKIDLHLRHQKKWNPEYCSPVISLFMVGTELTKQIDTVKETIDDTWTIEDNSKNNQFHFIHSDSKTLPHRIIVHLLDNSEDIAIPSSDKLNQVLMQQHLTSKLLTDTVNNTMNKCFLAMANYKKAIDDLSPIVEQSRNDARKYESEKKKQQGLRDWLKKLYDCLLTLKKESFAPHLNNNLMFTLDDFYYFWEALKQFDQAVEQALQAPPQDNPLENSEEETKLTGTLKTAQESFSHKKHDTAGNVFYIVNQYAEAFAKLYTAPPEQEEEVDKSQEQYWETQVDHCDNTLRQTLGELAYMRRQHFYPLLFRADANSRVTADSKNQQYRILQESFIADDIDYRIANARDFYFIHWLDHSRITYKRNAVNFRTTISQLANAD